MFCIVLKAEHVWDSIEPNSKDAIQHDKWTLQEYMQIFFQFIEYPNHVEEHPCLMPLKDSQTLLQPADKTRQRLYYHSNEHNLVPQDTGSSMQMCSLPKNVF